MQPLQSSNLANTNLDANNSKDTRVSKKRGERENEDGENDETFSRKRVSARMSAAAPAHRAQVQDSDNDSGDDEEDEEYDNEEEKELEGEDDGDDDDDGEDQEDERELEHLENATVKTLVKTRQGKSSGGKSKRTINERVADMLGEEPDLDNVSDSQAAVYFRTLMAQLATNFTNIEQHLNAGNQLNARLNAALHTPEQTGRLLTVTTSPIARMSFKTLDRKPLHRAVYNRTRTSSFFLSEDDVNAVALKFVLDLDIEGLETLNQLKLANEKFYDELCTAIGNSAAQNIRSPLAKKVRAAVLVEYAAEFTQVEGQPRDLSRPVNDADTLAGNKFSFYYCFRVYVRRAENTE